MILLISMEWLRDSFKHKAPAKHQQQQYYKLNTPTY